MTISLPLAFAVDVVLIAVGYSWGKGWLQAIPSWFKRAETTVEVVKADLTPAPAAPVEAPVEAPKVEQKQ